MTTTSPGGIALSRIVGELVIVMWALSVLFGGLASAQGYERDPAYAEFYPTLDPHGEWIEHPRHGLTWAPFANQDREWRPYSRGQWVFTEEHGWLWDSDEPFGWIVYHYGRWLLDPYHQWMWVPGTEWAPAWVAWREGEDAVGWMPLPPEDEFQGSHAAAFDDYASPRFSPMWMFVAPALMTMPAVHRHFYPAGRGSFFFGRTRFASHYDARDRRAFNRGIDRRFIEMRAQRPVPVLQVRPLNGPRDAARSRGPDGERRMVGVYRPQFPPGAMRGPGDAGRGPASPGRSDFPGRRPEFRDRPDGGVGRMPNAGPMLQQPARAPPPSQPQQFNPRDRLGAQSPPAGQSPAGLPPAGIPPAGTPPAGGRAPGLPPAGVPQAGMPPAGPPPGFQQRPDRPSGEWPRPDRLPGMGQRPDRPPGEWQRPDRPPGDGPRPDRGQRPDRGAERPPFSGGPPPQPPAPPARAGQPALAPPVARPPDTMPQARPSMPPAMAQPRPQMQAPPPVPPRPQVLAPQPAGVPAQRPPEKAPPAKQPPQPAGTPPPPR